MNKISNPNTLIYVVGELINKLIPFLLLPIIVRHLTVEEFGFFSLFIVSSYFAYIFVGLATSSYIPIVFFKNKQILNNNIYTSIIISLTLFILTSFILLIIKLSLEWLTNEWFYFLLLILLCGFLNNSFQIYLSLLQCEKKAVKYVLLCFFRSLLYFCLVLYFCFNGFNTPLYLMLSYVSPFLIIFLYLIYITAKNKTWSLKELKFDLNILKFSLPLMPSALSNWAKTSFDRYLIAALLGSAALGYYSAAYQLGFAIVFVSAALSKALSPVIFEEMKDYGVNKKVIMQSSLFSLLLIIISIIYAIFCFNFAVNILGEQYNNVLGVIVLLIIASCLQGISAQFVGIIYFMGNTSYVFKSNLISLLVHAMGSIFILNYFPSLPNLALVTISSTFIYLLLIGGKSFAIYFKES